MSDKNSFIIKGDIACSESQNKIVCHKNSYVICLNGICQGVFSEIPDVFRDLDVIDYTNRLVIPGLTDMHIHAPQFAFRGLGMDLELLDWLKKYTFVEEARYADMEYTKKAYGFFVDAIKKSATTRAVIFATVHRDATIYLMDLLEKAGIECYVGKVNMDRDAPEDLREPDASTSAFDTIGWINKVNGKYEHVKPILTPRFLPSCSDTLLTELHEIQMMFDLPVQSHLSENKGEVELVHQLFPNAAFYGEGYEKYHLFGNEVKTVMAHCIYSTEEEIALIKKNGVYVAHCPSSNMNLASGIAPIRRYLNEGIRVGIATDVAGGESESMFRATADAVQVSKLYHTLIDTSCAPLSFDEAFYLATAGGGEFFGKVGKFENGYEFDALVIDDAPLHGDAKLTTRQRLERSFYLEADDNCLVAKYVRGTNIFDN